jgi:hypothetical protein
VTDSVGPIGRVGRVGSVNPWEQRATAVASGFDPYSLTPTSARRRMGDAGHGRVVVVPVYLSRSTSGEPSGVRGVLVHLAPGGVVTLDPGAFPSDLGDQKSFWLDVHRASTDPRALAHRDAWVRITVETRRTPSAVVDLVLLESDWELLRSALALWRDARSGPQDAAAEHVLSRYLGRLDGEDRTPSAGLWGRLAFEVVTARVPGRLADTRSLRWQASWGAGGFPAGSGGRDEGCADSRMLLDLRHQRVVVRGRPFRVRTLPDWEREQAAHDLGMPPRRLLGWSVAPLATVLGHFDDIAPAPPPVAAARDAVHPPDAGSGPQDASGWPAPRDAP